MADTTPFIEPINPKDIITPHRPRTEDAAEKKIEAEGWFGVERMELNFGDEQGRPSKDIDARRETLDRLFADGWYVTEILDTNRSEDGEWQRVVTNVQMTRTQDLGNSMSHQSSCGSSCNRNDVCANSSSSSCTQSDSKNCGSSKATNGYNTWFGRTTADVNSTSYSCGHAKENGNASSNTVSNGSGNERSCGLGCDSFYECGYQEVCSTVTEGGAPYYFAYAKIRLERKRMQADRVLGSMVKTLVEDYNQGKTINLDRYDELVSLYALMLNRTEAEGEKMIEDGVDFTPLFDEVKAMVNAALANVTADSGDEWKQARIDEINRKFDALEGKIKAKLISEGRYNTTVYTSEISGNERERQYALNNVHEEIIKVELQIAEISANVGNNLMAAQVRIFEALQKKKIEPVNLRNTVFKWMLDFMERREDPYMGMNEMQTIAERLGYSGGIAAPSAALATGS